MPVVRVDFSSRKSTTELKAFDLAQGAASHVSAIGKIVILSFPDYKFTYNASQCMEGKVHTEARIPLPDLLHAKRRVSVVYQF